MKRLLFGIVLAAVGCGENPPPATVPPPASAPPPAPQENSAETPEKILEEAERERAGALYEKAAAAFTKRIEGGATDGAAYEGRALARWRLSLMRGNLDADVATDLEAAGDRPQVRALKALVRLVDGARERGWEPLAPLILKQVFAKAFPESAAFETDWAALVRLPQAEIQKICEALAGAPDWPLAAGVRAALEGGDVPTPGQEGILWILSALRLPPAEAMKTLESATGPDQGILMQAQAQLLAAEGRFTEAAGRMSMAPLPFLRAAAAVAAGKPAGDETSYLKAAALLQSGTPASLDELDKLPEAASVAWIRFERGIRRLAAGNRDGALEDLRATVSAGGAHSAAWLGFALWHLQDFDGAAKQLAAVAELKPASDLAVAIEETRGFALFAKGEEEAGAERIVAAATKGPSKDLFIRLAPSLRGNRQWKALQEFASPVARAVPADAEPWVARAEAFFWLKEYDAAIETVTFATQQKLDPKRLLRWRALSYEELDRHAEAHEDWSRLTDVVSQEGEAMCHRAWMSAKLARWSQVKDDAEQGISRGANPWALALGRFALAAEALHGPPAEGEEAGPEGRAAGALGHLRIAVKTGAVEPSDLEKVASFFAPLSGTEEWKKVVESSAEKQKELKDEGKRGGMLGVMVDHSGGSVAVTGTYRKSGARLAGLAPGDIILEVEGRRMIHTGDVGSILQGREPGQVVKVKIERELRPKLKMVQVREVALTTRNVFDD